MEERELMNRENVSEVSVGMIESSSDTAWESVSLSESFVMHVRTRWRRSRDIVADDCLGAIDKG